MAGAKNNQFLTSRFLVKPWVSVKDGVRRRSPCNSWVKPNGVSQAGGGCCWDSALFKDQTPELTETSGKISSSSPPSSLKKTWKKSQSFSDLPSECFYPRMTESSFCHLFFFLLSKFFQCSQVWINGIIVVRIVLQALPGFLFLFLPHALP